MGLFKRRPAAPVKRIMAAAGLPTAGGEIPVGDVVMEVAPMAVLGPHSER